ncbi:MAG: iron-containing alcohol dehydrogenase [Phycisphaerae bacterium]|nr:iron-containing alcohol dehydrogenase [Phycisphaerae bacterium]
MRFDLIESYSALRHSPVRIVFGEGSLRKLGSLAVEEGATRVLLVTDPGIVRAGHAERATQSLRDAGVEVTAFDGARENPTTHEVESGVRIARDLGVDFLVGLGGGSSMDCAKGINFILTNGGVMHDYWGIGKASKPMLPSICVPTTAGTGSEAQSFALITDPNSHQKMACGDRKALPRVAILDPELIATVPRAVAAATGIDAVAHAIETAACNKRTPASRELSRTAWRLLNPAFESAITGAATESHGRNPAHVESELSVSSAMLLGAHCAGAAIEASMLGAAHACANPLTSMYGATHGIAVGLMLPHVIRFNAVGASDPYSDLCGDGPLGVRNAEELACRVEVMLQTAGLPRRLSDIGVTLDAIPDLADMALLQWTARFNPRDLTVESLREIYLAAL